MLKRIVFFLFLALLSNVLWGDEFKVRILSCPKEVIVSAPVAITAEVTNVSGRVITVAYGHGGFTVSLDIRRSDGKPLPPYAGPYAKWSDNFQLESIPVGWKQAKTLDAVPLPVESCELVVQAVLASHGPYFHYDKGEKLPVEAWSGEVKSEEARIQIVEPSGVDKAAYDYFKGSPLSKPQDLLAKFPASTYAGYVLAHHGPALALQSLASLDDVEQTLRQFGYRGGSEENTQAHVKEMQDTMRQYAAKARPFLKAHPDFFYAPLIRRMYAMCLGLTGHLPEAMAEIQTLSTGTGKEADEAKAYLEAKGNR